MITSGPLAISATVLQEESLEPFVLTPEQGEAVKRMTAEPTRACLNSSGLGTGKTLMAVELAKALGAQTVLVVAPLNTHVNWELTFLAL